MTIRRLPRTTNQDEYLLDLLRRHVAYKRGQALHPGPMYKYHHRVEQTLRDGGWIEIASIDGFRVYVLTSEGAEAIKENTGHFRFILDHISVEDIHPPQPRGWQGGA